MIGRRRQVLADGHDRHAGPAEILQGFDNLIVRLAESEHDAGLDRNSVPGLRGEPQHLERFPVGRPGPDFIRQPFDRFNVVIEHRRSGRENGRNRFAAAVEIGGQHLDSGFRQPPVQRMDDGGEKGGAAVRQVVPGHAGDHDVIELEPGGGLGQTLRLVLLGRSRMRIVVDRAESAVARAASAEDQERRGSGTEALTDIRAERAGTDRVEPQVAQDSGHPFPASGADPDLQPVRQFRPQRPALAPHVSSRSRR